MRRMTRRTIPTGIAVVIAFVLAGGVVAAQRGGGSMPDVQALGEAAATDPMIRIADIAGTGDAPGRGVFAQVTSTGHFCLWDAPSAESLQRLGGCNPAEDPLGGGKLSVSFAYDGGPAVEAVRDARLIGVASNEVAQVRVVMSDGEHRTMKLRSASVGDTSYRAFGHRFKRSDFRKGVGPVAVLAVDESGTEIDREETGFVK